jgi:hypothetical protein
MASTPRTTALGACLEGWRRVGRAPVVWVGSSLAVGALVLPHRLSLFGDLGNAFGLRTALERALWEWHGGWALASLALWTFLSGGLLDRFARARPVRTAAFFAACGEYGVRFARLAVVTGPMYWALFIWLHPYLVGVVLPELTTGLTTRSQRLGMEAGIHALFLLAVALVAIADDYAKVRIVVEDRRSALGALAAGLRFVRRRPGRVIGLYLLGLLPAAVVVRLWQSAASTDGPHWFGAAALVVYVVLRVAVRLAGMAGAVVFFQGELAHAGYTAAPLPIWPDSPAAEALENLKIRNSLARGAPPRR